MFSAIHPLPTWLFATLLIAQAASATPPRATHQSSRPAQAGHSASTSSNASLTIPTEKETEDALYSEPEMRGINNIREDEINRNSLPVNDIRRSSPAQGIFQHAQTSVAARAAYLKLEDRLEKEVYTCHFCGMKQAELSMLIRVELRERHMMDSLANAMGAQGVSQQSGNFLAYILGGTVQNETDDPAKDSRRQAIAQAVASCTRPAGMGAAGACITPDEYEASWHKHLHMISSCLRASDWIEDASRRPAYEACLRNDPVPAICRRYTPDADCNFEVTSLNADLFRRGYPE